MSQKLFRLTSSKHLMVSEQPIYMQPQPHETSIPNEIERMPKKGVGRVGEIKPLE